MSADDPKFEAFEGMEAFERELAALRPAKPSLGVEEVIGLRLNEELEVAFVEALRGMGLPSPASRLEVGLERDLAWEFRLEDQLRGLPLRRPTVALGRAVEVQVNLRALRADEVVVPFPEVSRVEELGRETGGRRFGWVIRWGIAAALVVGGFGAGWKMAREAAKELRGGVIAGRFESEAARATARMAVGLGWEPAGVPLPEGVGEVGDRDIDLGLGSLGRLPSGPQRGVAAGGVGGEGVGRGLPMPTGNRVDGRPSGLALAQGGVGSDSRGGYRLGEVGGDVVRGDGRKAGAAEEVTGPLVVNGRLALRLASAQVPTAQGIASSALAEGAGQTARVAVPQGSPAVAGLPREVVAGGTGSLAIATGTLKLSGSEVTGTLATATVSASSAVGVRHGGGEDGLGVRTGSRILDAVGGGDLARVIPVEILNAMESGGGLSEVRKLMDARSLPVQASFSFTDMPVGSAEAESISVHDLDRLGQDASESDRGVRMGLAGGVGDREEVLRQMVYVAKDDELRLEVGKDAAGGLVARFERLDGHFLAADTVRSAADLELIANRARGVLGYLPSLNSEPVWSGPILRMGPLNR